MRVLCIALLCLVAWANGGLRRVLINDDSEKKMTIRVPAVIKGVLEDRLAHFDDKDEYEWISEKTGFRFRWKAEIGCDDSKCAANDRFKISEFYRITMKPGLMQALGSTIENLKKIECPANLERDSRHSQACFVYLGGKSGHGTYYTRVERKPLFKDLKKKDASLDYTLEIDTFEM